MKNKKRFLRYIAYVFGVIIVVAIALFVSRYKKLLPCGEKSISYIVVRNGNIGEDIRLNTEQQNKIVSIMKGVICTKITREPRVGWNYGVLIYADKHGPYGFYITGHDEVDIDGKKYLTDIEVIEKLNNLCESLF